MSGVMADINVIGQFRDMIGYLTSGTWLAMWEGLQLRIETFTSLGLSENASDILVWQTCQSCQVVLITGNRNAESPDSLEVAIRTLNQADSLPVITLSDPERFKYDRDYAERAAIKVMDYLLNLENYRSAGRLYAP